MAEEFNYKNDCLQKKLENTLSENEQFSDEISKLSVLFDFLLRICIKIPF